MRYIVEPFLKFIWRILVFLLGGGYYYLEKSLWFIWDFTWPVSDFIDSRHIRYNDSIIAYTGGIVYETPFDYLINRKTVYPEPSKDENPQV